MAVCFVSFLLTLFWFPRSSSEAIPVAPSLKEGRKKERKKDLSNYNFAFSIARFRGKSLEALAGNVTLIYCEGTLCSRFLSFCLVSRVEEITTAVLLHCR
jgi:hypothetical protein